MGVHCASIFFNITCGITGIVGIKIFLLFFYIKLSTHGPDDLHGIISIPLSYGLFNAFSALLGLAGLYKKKLYLVMTYAGLQFLFLLVNVSGVVVVETKYSSAINEKFSAYPALKDRKVGTLIIEGFLGFLIALEILGITMATWYLIEINRKTAKDKRITETLCY